MKTIIRLPLSMLILLAFIFGAYVAKAEEGENKIIVIGQVTTKTYGNPLKDHKVIIESDSSAFSSFEYYKEVYTDEDGYYYDTIYTNIKSGALIVTTYDRFDSRYDTTLFYRFFDDWTDNDPLNDNVFIADFCIYMESQNPILQADFVYKLAFTDNQFLYTFTDITDCEDLLSWEWDFGDGVYSHEQHPQHLFLEAGTYRVSLKVTGLIEGEEVTNSNFKYIYISKYDYYHLGGHGQTPTGNPPFPIDVGLAYLYHKDSDNIVTAIDTAKMDTLGYYYFYQVPVGEYCVKVQPHKQSEYYGVLMPTYYGNEVFWENAEFFELLETNWGYNIQLIEGNGLPSGAGEIKGLVTDEFNVGNGFSPLTSGIDVFLLNSNGEIITSCYTDYYSEFKFGDIAFNTYYVTPEITGVPNSKIMIQLDAENPQVDQIMINVHTGEVVLDIGDNEFLDQTDISNPFPNPANSYVNIKINTDSPGETQVEIIDLQGRIRLSNNSQLSGGMNNITLQTSDLENGIYLIRVKTESQLIDRKFVINK